MRARLRRWAALLQRDVHALWLAARDPRTPWYAKWLALAIAAYAVSPIDLIPDFIPLLGLLDDLLIVPIGLWIVLRMIPTQVLDEHRAAARSLPPMAANNKAAFVIALLWLGCTAALVLWWMD
ncbi:MAG: DUF1232 domain-containing protein [Burkholderiales bacterium]|nr:DUF1232 domain-containing protein [Burkholderiales bacterium]